MSPKLPRIVSLDAAATEIVCLLGGVEGLVALSPDSDGPAEIQGVTVLASTSPTVYRPDEALLRALRPEVILARRGCVSEAPNVTFLTARTVEGVFDDILTVGEVLGLESAGLHAVVALRGRLFGASEVVNPFEDGPDVAVLQSASPLVVGGLWIPQLVERAGGRHPLNPAVPKENAGAASGPQMAERIAGPARPITPEELSAANPRWVILSLAGCSYLQSQAAAAELARQTWWRELEAFKRGRVVVVDGDRSFNRPGPGLAGAFEFLVGLLHEWSEMIPADFSWLRAGR